MQRIFQVKKTYIIMIKQIYAKPPIHAVKSYFVIGGVGMSNLV